MIKFFNAQTVRKVSAFLFIVSVLLLIISFIDLLLRWNNIIEININYTIVSLPLVIITLLFSLLQKSYKRFFTVLISAISFLALMLFVIMTGHLHVDKPIMNSDYILRAEMHQYKILKRNKFYNVMIASKSSSLFFSPNMKTGIAPSFKIKLIEENPHLLILGIDKGYLKRNIKDTLRKFK